MKRVFWRGLVQEAEENTIVSAEKAAAASRGFDFL